MTRAAMPISRSRRRTYAPLRSADVRDAHLRRSVQESRARGAELARAALRRGGWGDPALPQRLSGQARLQPLRLDATIQPTPPPNPFPRVTSDQFVRERVFTQELNVISPTDGRFDWVVGAYWQRNKIDVVITQLSDGFPTNIDIKNKKTITGYFAQVGYQPHAAAEAQRRRTLFDLRCLLRAVPWSSAAACHSRPSTGPA